MSDAFNDVLDDADSDNDTTTFASSHSEDAEDSLSNTTTTVTEVASQFADATRSQFTTEDADTGFRNGDVYDDPDGTGGADDTDPRKLFRPPTLNELRYYSREGPYGPAVIKKPINDAFKHGFEVTGDNTEREDGDGTIERFLKDEYLDYYRIAEIKSRRDGLCVLMHQVADPETSVSKPIPRDGSATFEDFQLWTVDNLSDELAPTTVADHTDYTKDQIYVSEGEENGGIAVVDDISHPDHGDVVGYGVKPRKDSTDVQNGDVSDQGGCKGCKYWSVCNGGCPSSGVDEDWRNRTIWCGAKYTAYEKIEKRMRETFPNIQLVTDLPWDANITEQASHGRLDLKPFAAMRPDVRGRSSDSGYADVPLEYDPLIAAANVQNPENLEPGEARKRAIETLTDTSGFEAKVRAHELRVGEENVAVDYENQIVYTDTTDGDATIPENTDSVENQSRDDTDSNGECGCGGDCSCSDSHNGASDGSVSPDPDGWRQIEGGVEE
jgi:hypothetical protein